MNDVLTRRFLLARHPVGPTAPEDFRLEAHDLGTRPSDRVRVRSLLWGVDPGLRSRMTGAASYTAGLQVGGPISGFTVGEVVASDLPAFPSGAVVLGSWGWTEFADVDPAALEQAPDRGDLPLESLLGVLGIPGITAFLGVRQIGRVSPGDRVLVSSAAGGVGSLAAQIAAIEGATVTGLAGGTAKCTWLRDELGLAGTIDHTAEPDLTAAFGQAFPDGIDVVFDNVGNRVIDAALPHMRDHGRIVVCGQVQDMDLPPAERAPLRNTRTLVTRRLRIEGFVALDHRADFDEARARLREWAAAGRLQGTTTVEVGFERLPAAFTSLFSGGNRRGRTVVAAG